MLNVLIIGNGFLGRAALEALEQHKYSCLIVGRKKYVDISANQFLIDELLGMPQNIFETLKLHTVVYALGDPRFTKQITGEQEILEKILKFLEFHQFGGTFILLSSNAANPDSGKSRISRGRTLANDYINRKLDLEKLTLSSNLKTLVIRVPAIVGLNMSNKSHIMRLIQNKYLNLFLCLPVFKGTIEILTKKDFGLVMLKCMQSVTPGSIVEPLAPTFTWASIARYLSGKNAPTFQRHEYMSKKLELVSQAFPINLRLLLFPHWVLKGEITDNELKLKHIRVIQTLELLRSGRSENRKFVLVTGVGSGLGGQLMKTLVNSGYNVIGIDKVSKSKVIDYLNLPIESFSYLKGNLKSKLFLTKVASLIEDLQVQGVLAVAGVGPRGSAITTSSEESKEIFTINFHSTIALYTALIKSGEKNKFFCYIGSSVGTLSIPYYSAYSASKSALESFFFSSINEQENADVAVLGVIPSGMKSNFQNANGVQDSSRIKIPLLEPAQVAKVIVDWVDKEQKPSTIKHVGLSSRLFLILRIFPFKSRLILIRRIAQGRR
jgi:short-subunit dehydrogenase